MTERATDEPADADLAGWAKAVAAAVTPAELVRLVADYREQVRNPRRAAADREFAERRADALAKFTRRLS
jgi:glycine betaine/choline ABC-type transport system substrate-binding protein